MSVTLNPYLSFRDNAREALGFYHSVFGGSLTLSTYAEGGQSDDPAEAEKIMHGQIEGDNGIVLMCADTPADMPLPSNSTSLSLSGDDGAVLRGYWDLLVDGGSIVQPLTMAPWGDSFGMCADRYGINWMVNISGPTPE